MGSPPDYERDGQPDHPYEGSWAQPRENLEEGGCPGAYYRTPWVESVMRYYRRRDDNGNRIANPALDRCDDPLVHEAVLELEYHEDSWRAEYESKRAEMMRQQQQQ